MKSMSLEVSFDYDFVVVGISCFEKGYRMCWYLNNALDLALGRDEELQLYLKKKESEHDRYTYFDKEDQREYTLLKNRGTNGLISPTYASLDFVLKIDREEDFEVGKFMQKLRGISCVRLAQHLNIEQMKEKNNFIWE